jgi:hypothetical protein
MDHGGGGAAQSIELLSISHQLDLKIYTTAYQLIIRAIKFSWKVVVQMKGNTLQMINERPWPGVVRLLRSSLRAALGRAHCAMV